MSKNKMNTIKKNNKLIAELIGWGENNGFLFPPGDESMHAIDGWDGEDVLKLLSNHKQLDIFKLKQD